MNAIQSKGSNVREAHEAGKNCSSGLVITILPDNSDAAKGIYLDN